MKQIRRLFLTFFSLQELGNEIEKGLTSIIKRLQGAERKIQTERRGEIIIYYGSFTDLNDLARDTQDSKYWDQSRQRRSTAQKSAVWFMKTFYPASKQFFLEINYFKIEA